MKLSKTSKLGTYSWSLIARDTCPGSIDSQGGLVPACRGCYAVGGNYRFANVKKPREHNRADWQRDGWVQDMVEAIQHERYFRWFDSGDMYSLGLARKILEVMQQTPDTRHWLPTRMHKFQKFHGVLFEMEALPNVRVRRSSDSVTGEFDAAVHGSVIYSQEAPQGTYACPAYKQEGQCKSCRACYSKDVSVIAYQAHGKTMAKVVRLIATGA